MESPSGESGLQKSGSQSAQVRQLNILPHFVNKRIVAVAYRMHLYNSFKLLEILLLPSTTAPQRDLRMRPLEFMEESATPKVEPLWVDVVSYRQMAAMRLLTKEAD
jgi:hypothetical protein